MVSVYRNLATDRIFEEAENSIFVCEDDPASRLEAYVAVDSTISSNWQELSPAEDSSNAGCAVLEHPVEKEPVKSKKDASTGNDKVTLLDPDALREYTRTPRPLCGFFVRKRNSYSALSLSLELFDQLCGEISIPRQFRDHLVYFGSRQFEVEIAPPPFSLEASPPIELNAYPEWEAMGVIRFMGKNAKVNVPNPSERWSIRQTAVFFRFDGQRSRAVWLFVSLSSSVEALLGDIWASAEHESQSPWQTLHALLFYAACNWRPYVVALMHEVEQHEMNLLGTSPNNSGPIPLPEAEERQALLILEKQISTAKLAIQSTKADVHYLQEQLLSYPAETSTDSPSTSQSQKRQLIEIVRHLDVNLMRLEALRSCLQNLTGLVSSFLELNSGYALQGLTEESRRENQTMRKLNEKMAIMAEKNTEEAVTVTVLAVLTMIYLPFTVVTDFFSTSFVGLGTDRIFVTRDCWILFLISVPLTILTIYIWRVWTEIKVRRRYPVWWHLLALKYARQSWKQDHIEAYNNYDCQTLGVNGNSP